MGVGHSHGGQEGEGGQEHGGAHGEGEGGVGGRGPVLQPQVERQEGAGAAAAGEQDPGLDSQDVEVSQGLGWRLIRLEYVDELSAERCLTCLTLTVSQY